MGRFKFLKLLLLLLLIPILLVANNREKYNFNSQWLVHIGDVQGGEKQSFADKDWKKLYLAHLMKMKLLKLLLEK